MDRRLRAAVDASRAWYDDVFALHGIAVVQDERLWVAHGEPPPFHSAVKTLDPSATEDDVLAVVERHPHGTVADSFGTLDLTEHGFDVLIDATWVWHDEVVDAVWPEGWLVVRDAPLLARWTAAHDYADVLTPAVLEHPRVAVLGRWDAGELVGGAVLHDAGRVVGLSNVWTAGPGQVIDVPGLLSCAAALHPGRGIVDYERGPDLEQLVAAGFEPLGPQRVWRRTGGRPTL